MGRTYQAQKDALIYTKAIKGNNGQTPKPDKYREKNRKKKKKSTVEVINHENKISGK